MGSPIRGHVRTPVTSTWPATKLDLPESEADHRRVLAVLRFLDARNPSAEESSC
jgi:hypothetical protein